MNTYVIISTSGNNGFAEMRVHKKDCSQIAREERITWGNSWPIEANTADEAIDIQVKDFLDQDMGCFDFQKAPCVKREVNKHDR